MDEETFSAIFHEHRDAVYRYARVLTRSNAAAEDIAQECFLSLTNFDAARGPVRAYLLGAVRRQAFKRFRNLWRESEEVEVIAVPADTARDVAVRQAVESLPALQREAIALFHWEGYSLDEIAAISMAECDREAIVDELEGRRSASVGPYGDCQFVRGLVAGINRTCGDAHPARHWVHAQLVDSRLDHFLEGRIEDLTIASHRLCRAGTGTNGHVGRLVDGSHATHTTL